MIGPPTGRAFSQYLIFDILHTHGLDTVGQMNSKQIVPRSLLFHSSKWMLLTILIVFGVLVILYSWLTPPFEGSDEPQHFAYVEWLADGKGFPPQGDAAWDTPVQQEASQPPLYYLLASIPARLINRNDQQALYRPNPNFPSNAPGMTPDNKNIAIHYPADIDPLQGGWLALYLARGLSLIFGILLLVSVYGLARQIVPDQHFFALSATLLVALIPQVIFVSGVVSNDMAAAATGALTLWLLAIMVNKGPSTWLGLALGAVFGLAILSKVSAITLAVPIAGGIVWLWWSRSGDRRRLLGATAAILIGSLLVAGWWYLRTWTQYGAPLGLGTHYQAPWAVTSPGDRISPVRAWLEVFSSFWIAFGWGNIKFPGWTYAVIGVLVLTAIMGLVRLTWRWWHDDRRLRAKPVMMILLALAVLGLSVALEVWMGRVTAPHGRLLFPALAAIAVLLVSGWWAIRPWLVGLALAAFLIMTILSPPLLIRPAYALPEALTEEEMSKIVGPETVEWQFGQLATLRGVVLGHQSVAAGGTLPISLCWQTISPSRQDYTVLIHIVGPDNHVVGSRHTYPGLGSYPTSIWEPDRLFCDDIVVDIPAELPETLLYQVEIGILDSQADERLPVYDKAGGLLTHTFVNKVRLQADNKLEALQPPDGDGAIRLIFANFPQQWQPGADHEVSLQWWAASELELDYTVFIHLRDPLTGDNVAQGDGPPLMGWYPTSDWIAGEAVFDNHIFSLPDQIPAGAYDLVAGWYDPATGQRLGEEYLLGTIEAGQ